MFGILISSFNFILGWIVRSAIVKFVVFFAFYFLVHEFVAVLASLLPGGADLATALGGIPASVYYFLDLFRFSTGFPALVSAYALRFIIRRMPVIG